MRYLIFIFCAFLSSCENEKDIADDSSKKPALEVVVEKAVQSELYEVLAFAGTVEPSQRMGLYSKAPGVITKIFPKLGEKVKKNQIIMEVSPRDIHFQAFNILSPIDGFFTQHLAEVGRRIDQNQKLGVVAKLDSFEVSIQASLKDLSYLKQGAMLDVVLAKDTKLEQKTKGSIKEISPVASPLTGTSTVLVEILCRPGEPCSKSLRAGTYAKVFLQKNQRTGIKIPASYLVDNNSKLILLTKENKIKRVEITIGKNYGDKVEILKGLEPGDLIVVFSSRHAKDGEEAVLEK